MWLRARSWGFVIGVKVDSPAMMMSIVLETLAATVFGATSVGYSGNKLSH